MSIRVLHLVSGLRRGGAERCVQYLAEHMPPDRVTSLVYPLRPEVREFEIAAPVFEGPRVHYDPRKFGYLLRVCREQRVDIIHAHLHKAIVAAALATAWRPVRVIAHEHGPVFRRGAQYTAYRLGLRLLRRRVDRFVAVSQATRQRLMAAGHVPGDAIEVIHNPIDLEVFGPTAARRAAMRQAWHVAPGETVIGYVGRLHHVKGVDLLLRAAAELMAESDRWRVVLAGDGSERASLERLAGRLGVAGRVRFLGRQDDVAAVISGFDVGVMPSRAETFGLVALEMMAMGTPLVCSGVDGLGEFVHDGETGLIPTDNQPAPLARAIRRVIEDETLRGRLVEAGLAHVRTFSVDRFVGRVLAVYEQVMSRPR